MPFCLFKNTSVDVLMRVHFSNKQTLSLLTIAVLCLLGAGRAMRQPATKLPPSAVTATASIANNALLRKNPDSMVGPILLLRNNCQACHSLVRVLLRRTHNPQIQALPLTLVTNASWPELDSLSTSKANAVIISPLAADLPVTPAAFASTAAVANGSLVWGTLQITQLLDTLKTNH